MKRVNGFHLKKYYNVKGDESMTLASDYNHISPDNSGITISSSLDSSACGSIPIHEISFDCSICSMNFSFLDINVRSYSCAPEPFACMMHANNIMCMHINT